MAISVSSYEIIFPDSRQIVIVNARPGERVDTVFIVNPSPTHIATLQCFEDIQSMFHSDGGPAFTTCFMELKTNQGSEAILKSLDGSNVLDDEKCEAIISYIMKYESFDGNSDGEDKDEDVCVICQQKFETGDMTAVLECEHGYHEECIDEWLQKKKDCPVCRAKVPCLSKIRIFEVGSNFLTIRVRS